MPVGATVATMTPAKEQPVRLAGEGGALHSSKAMRHMRLAPARDMAAPPSPLSKEEEYRSIFEFDVIGRFSKWDLAPTRSLIT